MLLNLTNHPVNHWPDAQRAEAERRRKKSWRGANSIRTGEKLIAIKKQGWTQRRFESGGKQNNVYTLRKVYTLYKIFTIYRFMTRLPDDCLRK